MASMIVIVGPTAVGKTELAVLCAERIGAEIVSCDAMQVYQEISIASCKPDAALRARVPHHLLDIVSVVEEFDAARFCHLAEETVAQIVKRDRIPVAVGGSGMYVQALVDGIFVGPGKDPDLRLRLLLRAEQEGAEALYQELQEVDPQSAARLHPHDLRRVIRALEVYALTHRPISAQQPIRQGLAGPYHVCLYGLQRPRQELYDRINQRVDEMFAGGLVEEIRGLQGRSLSATASRMIGIREVQGYLQGEYDLERARYLLKLHTRHYAKRQLTWFRREKRIQWLSVKDDPGYRRAVERIVQDIKGNDV